MVGLENRFLKVALVAFLSTACVLTPEQEAALEGAFDCTEAEGCPLLPPDVDLDPPQGPACFVQRFVQPEAEVTKKVDILFVTDTSGSMNQEKQAIAEGIDAFIEALPPDVDYQIGVMLAHGTDSAWSGKLFHHQGIPAVLKSTEMSVDQIKHKLRSNMIQPSELITDGGELGLGALNRALDPEPLANIRAQGFFREEAALAVIQVSDENAICAQFPENVTPVPDPNNREIPAYDLYCERTAPASDLSGSLVSAHEEVVTPELVAQKLLWLQGDRPLLLSAIVYNQLDTVPSGGENEYGYGHMEFVEAANGISVDLASGNYVEGLGAIGSLVTMKLDLIYDFTLSSTDVIESSIDVQVDGFSTGDYLYNSTLNQVHVSNPGGALSLVDISYCIEDPNGDDDGSGDDGGDDGSGDDDGGDDGSGDDDGPGTPPVGV